MGSRRTGCATLVRKGGGRNFNAKVGHGELEDGRGRKGRGRGRDRAEEQTRTSLAGTQGGASPQTRALMRKSPPFWSGRDDVKGGGAKGKERPLRHNGKGMELVWGGEGSSEPAVEWTAARSSSRPARTRVRWVPVGGMGRARRPGGGGTLCLALPTPRTDSGGAQGLWKVNLQPNHS